MKVGRRGLEQQSSAVQWVHIPLHVTPMKFANMLGVLLLCVLALAGLWQSGIAGAANTVVRRNLCNYIDGKWAPAYDRCIKRSCYTRHDCGYVLHPSCSGVSIGDPIGEIYFHLGEPSGVDGNTYWWCEGKPGCNRKIFAQIEDRQLKKLNCP